MALAALALTIGAASAQTGSTTSAEWKIDGGPNQTETVITSGVLWSKPESGEGTAFLMTCIMDRLSLWFAHRDRIFDADAAEVTYRIDGGPPHSVSMPAFENKRAFSLPDADTAKPFLDQIVGGRTLDVVMRDKDTVLIEASFDISRMREAYDIVVQPCGKQGAQP
ncbi:hypothetical protein [Stappia sp. 28M-7]|uniref:hypothetical protein n=1 Tax=Stappia sp. 28M-7 TaxID=2762596 RepID=UPI00163BAA33|nr:hypothetical protein [Stappia sp. 28M-7]MBC2858711.1 hypothetical protein [Stappia sp. 28M-7]